MLLICMFCFPWDTDFPWVCLQLGHHSPPGNHFEHSNENRDNGSFRPPNRSRVKELLTEVVMEVNTDNRNEHIFISCYQNAIYNVGI
jgi:hypothetical protein